MTTNEQAEKIFGEKLDSTIFTWQNYCGVTGVSVLTIFDYDNGMINSRFICEGWCEAGSLISNMSKTQGVAIMLWDKDNKEQVWCHVSKDLTDTLYKWNELNR